MSRNDSREPVQQSTLLVEKTPQSRGDGTFSALDPCDEGLWDLRVTPKFLNRCSRISMGEAKTLGITVPTVCSAPTRIYQGVREEDEQEWLCYCGMPDTRFEKSGREVKADESEVFPVFVNDERRVYAFAWERSEGPNSGVPIDWRNRFLRRVYP